MRSDTTRCVCAYRYELRMLQLSEEAQRAGEGLGKLNYMYTICLDKNEELKTKANTLQSQVPLCMCPYTTVYVLALLVPTMLSIRHERLQKYFLQVYLQTF